VATKVGEYLYKLGRLYKNLDQKAAAHARELDECANSLRESADHITSVLVDEERGLIPATNKIVQDYKKSKHFNTLVLTGEFDDIQGSFIRVAGLEGRSGQDLRIVGTMLGTFGENGLNLSQHLSNLTTSHESNLTPFKRAYFAVPGHVNGGVPTDDDDYYLYPYSARITAADVLLKQTHARLNEHLEVHIRFLPCTDIFPAIQLWDEACGMILPSAGVRDRTSDRTQRTVEAVTEALPLALVFLSNYKLTVNDREINCSLANTLSRLKKHLEHDYGLKEGGCEVWRLAKSRDRIEVHNYNRDLEEHALFIREVRKKFGDPGVTEVETIIDTFSGSDVNGIPIANCRLLVDKLMSYIEGLTSR